MPLNKMGEFTFNHTGQQDDLYSSMTAAEIKTAFDSRGNELKTALNNLVDALKAQTTGDSGAQHIGIEPISGVTGTNVQDALEDLRLDINSAVAGTIPDGSITKEKLAFQIATDATSVTIADVNNRFTSTNVEGALDELFTSANSVKTNVSGAIGSPATASDTGATLAGYINTEKGRIASNVGDGAGTDSLKYLVDRLATRLDELAANVNAKGVPATSADTLAQLVTKVSQISSGKKSLSGTVSSSASTLSFNYVNGTVINKNYVSVTGLSFEPTLVYLIFSNATSSWASLYIKDPLDTLYVGPTVKLSTYDADSITVASDNIKGNAGNALVNNGSFLLPFPQGSVSVKWTAIE